MSGVRRTWNKELYEQKARERLEKGDDFVDEQPNASSSRANRAIRQEFAAAGEDDAGPMGSDRAFLRARDGRLGLEERAGKVEIINPTDAEGLKAGFWCETCSVLLKDSAAYLSHVNGKRHQRALGFSMRVERADVSDVRERLDQLHRAKSNPVSDAPRRSAIEEYEERLQLEAQAKEELKRKRKEEDLERKKRVRLETEQQPLEDDDDDDDDADEMAAMMGFGGFGSSKRK